MEKRIRDARLADEPPTVRAVLEAALTATRGDGIDWQSRLKSAQLLMQLPAEDPEETEKPYLHPEVLRLLEGGKS